MEAKRSRILLARGEALANLCARSVHSIRRADSRYGHAGGCRARGCARRLHLALTQGRAANAAWSIAALEAAGLAGHVPRTDEPAHRPCTTTQTNLIHQGWHVVWMGQQRGEDVGSGRSCAGWSSGRACIRTVPQKRSHLDVPQVGGDSILQSCCVSAPQRCSLGG